MRVQNMDIAEIFVRYADLLEIVGANPFRVRSYRKAAQMASSLPRNLYEMANKGEDLTKLDGIGKDLAAKIQEILVTGRLSNLEALENRTSPDLYKLLKIPSLGPKRIRALNQKLGITNLDSLKRAAAQGKLRSIEGFGQKTEKRIFEELRHRSNKIKRIYLFEAEQRAVPLLNYLSKTKGLDKVTVAGSYRRRLATVGDLDILAASREATETMDRFVGYENIRKIVSKGTTKSTVVLRSGLQVDLRVVPQTSYGAALHYFTGSKGHNIAVRMLGVKKGFKINEYGVFKKDKRITGETEKNIYETVGLQYIPPELRENNGEIEAAKHNSLPNLVSCRDLRGDLHSHTNATDGHDSLETMAEAAIAKGYEYLAITEHSKRVSMARGLDTARLAAHIHAIEELNTRLDDIRLLKGIEVDILEDGSLDLPDDILKELDLTVCSIHYNRNLSRQKQTERIIRAMDNRFFNILGHPTGRLINERDAYDVDLEKIMDAAVERGCFLEVNAHPKRLDLSDRYCKMAKEKKLKLVISTDAHSRHDFDLIRFGVDQARRGWLEKSDILNTRSWNDLRKILKR